MCTQLLNMKHTYTHPHLHTHTAYWSRVRRREVVALPRSGPIDRRIAAVPSRVPARPQRIRARARSTIRYYVPRPSPPLYIHMYLYLYLHLYLCLVTSTSAVASSRGESVRSPSYSRLIFICRKQFPFFIFKFTLWSTYFRNMPSDENNRPSSPWNSIEQSPHTYVLLIVLLI